jgi:hypothetical protein
VVGFLLLDPLWRGGKVVGYVTSVTRAACGAHPGESGPWWSTEHSSPTHPVVVYVLQGRWSHSSKTHIASTTCCCSAI